MEKEEEKKSAGTDGSGESGKPIYVKPHKKSPPNIGALAGNYSIGDAIKNSIYSLDWDVKGMPTLSDLTNISVGNVTTKWKPLSVASLDSQMNLLEEITNLKRKLLETRKELDVEASDKRKAIDEYTKLTAELNTKEKINHIIPRIKEEAREKLLKSSDFVELFEDAKSCECVVVSIDIRRSTELMLKARKPELFSKFITELSSKLSENIIGNYGIFDKFTGDGILAFFPKFYSGEDAIVRALKSAEECHEIFDKHYHASKSCFNVFINDVGLGIGIDYGTVTLVNTSNELTVVGIPVVYACRMSGAKAGDTILNQPAKEEIEKICSTQIKLIDTTILIKNEGTAEVYKVEVNKSVYNSLQAPEWIDSQKEEVENEINEP